ncbi:MAG: phytase [Acidobacteria bacterium]|nr:phytase [Acidobacteriota bacterium]
MTVKSLKIAVPALCAVLLAIPALGQAHTNLNIGDPVAKPLTPAPVPADTIDITAVVETVPVPVGGDAADDPAIWVNPKDSSKSLVLGTNKQLGLHVYDLAGSELQMIRDGKLNNVDLRDGFKLGTRTVALVTAGNRSTNSISVYALDPATLRVENVAARLITTAPAYGSCMYRSAKTGKFYYILANKVGTVEQWELFDNGAGKVDGKLVRTFKLDSQIEGCVADDELGHLYIGEEAVGIWKFGAEPDAGDVRTPMAMASGGRLTIDVEGMAIAKSGPKKGFIVVSSQGNNTYVVFRREGSNEYVRTVRVVDGDGIDGTSDTDGLDVTSADLGGRFRHGLMVVQDGFNDKGFQNFKYVPLEKVLGDR